MTLANQIAAAHDNDLLARLIAAAEQKGVLNAQGWVEQNRGLLVARDVAGVRISEVFAFARSEKGLPAGADPAYVTDTHLLNAVDALLNDVP